MVDEETIKTKLDFVKRRKLLLTVILLFIVVGISYTLISGFNFAVDFTGGTSITVNTTEKIDLKNYTVEKEDVTKDEAVDMAFPEEE